MQHDYEEWLGYAAGAVFLACIALIGVSFCWWLVDVYNDQVPVPAGTWQDPDDLRVSVGEIVVGVAMDLVVWASVIWCCARVVQIRRRLRRKAQRLQR